MFLEYMTYRFRGHSMGDPERYRKSDEVKRWEKDDPIGIIQRSPDQEQDNLGEPV